MSDERYPIGRGHVLHLHTNDAGTWVWLNTDEQDYDGLCVGRGTGRTDAITITLMAVDRLRNKLIELLAREGNK